MFKLKLTCTKVIKSTNWILNTFFDIDHFDVDHLDVNFYNFDFTTFDNFDFDLIELEHFKFIKYNYFDNLDFQINIKTDQCDQILFSSYLSLRSF